ncbi:MAG TPA: hypothetical protein VF188_18090 [Longimicrobiales bacterium]
MRQDREFFTTAQAGGLRGRLVLLAALAALVACDGENLFDEDGGAVGKPEIVEFTAPDTVIAGRFVDLRVHAKGDRRIVQFDLQARGAIGLDSTAVVAAPRNDVTQDISFVVEPPVQDTLLEVRVRAMDQTGSVSDLVADTIFVEEVTAPAFDAVTADPTTTGAGETVSISIEAADNIGLSSVGYAVVNEDGDTIFSELAPVAGSKRDSLRFDFQVPLGTPPSTLRIIARAIDHAGFLAVAAPVTLTIIDRSEPAVEIRRPGGEATVPLGDSVLVEVRVIDNVGVVSARLTGVALRGDPDLGTDQEVARFGEKTITLNEPVQDTTLKRYLLPTGDQTSEQVHLIVSATDGSGEVGADTVVVSLGGPRVEIRSPTDGEVVQSAVSVTLHASDPSGIEFLQLIVSGVVEDTVSFSYPTPQDSVLEQPTITLPADQAGTLELRAIALSGEAIEGRATPVSLTVDPASDGSDGDELPPELSLEIVPCGRVNCERFELTDSVSVRVHASDNNVIARLGVTAIAVNVETDDTVSQQRVITFSPALSGLVQRDFSFAPFNVDPLTLPDTLSVEFYAFAVDAAGNCAAAVLTTEQQLACGTFNGDTVAAGNVGGLEADVIAVAGHTVMLPGGGAVGDAVVEMDTANNEFRLYLSNFSGNSVEVLSLADTTFGAPIRVGAQPLGLFIDRSGDTLFVANSGGDNISIVPLDATPAEDVARRILTPNAVLYQIHYTEDNVGRITYTVETHDFSDRPQFLAVDSLGRLLYSTAPTGAAPDGTVRVVNRNPVSDPLVTADRPEIRILFDPADAIEPAENAIAVANVDSAIILSDPAGNDLLVFYDHKPGFPDSTVQAGMDEGLAFFAALDSLEARSGDTTIVHLPGTWVLERVGMSDTTYLGAAGDLGTIAFGEGATSPTGRIMIWNAAKAGISDEVAIADLVNNASDRVLGVGLNQNGSVGVFRGAQGAYFFNDNLRLLGLFDGDLGDHAAGAALHWAHNGALVTDETATAFVATARQTIKVINTLHFYQVNELYIRDNIAGPIRVTAPLPSDNGGQGAACTGPDCVVAKLYGVTSSGGVVVLDIRRRDITGP